MDPYRIPIPPLLQELPDAPKQLFARGGRQEYTSVPNGQGVFLLDQVINQEIRKPPLFLTIVGSRKHSPYGRDVTRVLVRGLANYAIVIVSGLALGIDRWAHEYALEYSLPTIAVLGSGLSDQAIYPREHLRLAQRITASGGMLISEYQHHQTARHYTFPRRNRIMAGISQVTLIIESTEKSGTAITARLAMEYNRDVLTVPGSIFNQHVSGNHLLIKEGATPITSSQDLIEALGLDGEDASIPSSTRQLKPKQQQLRDILNTPQNRQTLLEQSGFSMDVLNQEISLLELQGLITESNGMIRWMH